MNSADFIKEIYHNKLISRIFHTSIYCLQRELRGCDTVLDLGCGPSSPLEYCEIKYCVGVDAFKPYIKESKRKEIHEVYFLADIRYLEFDENSFDVVIMIEVLEHLTKQDGIKMLAKAEYWAKKKVIVTTPNDWLPQGVKDGNPLQRHRSGWGIDEMLNRGYKAYGMAGWEYLRRENTSDSMVDTNSIFSSIRFKPKLFWLIVSEITQLFTYYFPKYAFEIFYMKNLNESDEKC